MLFQWRRGKVACSSLKAADLKNTSIVCSDLVVITTMWFKSFKGKTIKAKGAMCQISKH